MLGAAAGILFGVSDVAIKAISGMVASHGALGLISPWTLVTIGASIAAFYASAKGLQDGDAVPVIAVTGTAANVAGIVGGIIVFGDPLSGNPLTLDRRVCCLPARARRRLADAGAGASRRRAGRLIRAARELPRHDALRRVSAPRRRRTTKTHVSGARFDQTHVSSDDLASFRASWRSSDRFARKRRDRPSLTCVSVVIPPLTCVPIAPPVAHVRTVAPPAAHCERCDLRSLRPRVRCRRG